MRSVAEHAAIVAGLIRPTGIRTVGLAESAGRVLAVDIFAPLNLPPFANSAMDGYAVRTADLTAFPIALPVSQDIPAGHPGTALAPGTAARIMTGAPIPVGADTIVPVERTDAGTITVRIDGAPPPGIHIRRVGDDVAEGTLVLKSGTVLRPPHLGVAAALGMAELPVRAAVRVLILSTGTELAAPGRPLQPGQIYESNAAMLAAAVAEAGGDPVIAHFVSDDVAEFRAELTRAAEGVDLIITSGGVSAGAYEVVKDALTGQGVTFAKVAMQPGMPQGAGTVDGVPLVALPGNPVSSYVSFEVFLRPAIRAAIGHPDVHRPVVRRPLGTPIESPPGKRQFRRAVLQGGSVLPWGGPGSHLLAWLAGADGMIVVPENVTALPAGADVQVWSLGSPA